MDALEAVLNRRSIRKYKPDYVSDELIEMVLEAARWAPTGSNLQAWSFIVVRDSVIINMLLKVSPGILRLAPYTKPPLVIVVCSDRKRAYEVCGRLGRDYLAIVDSAMAVQNMLLAVHSLGLGACPIKSFAPSAVKEILGIPCEIEPELMVTIGYPDEKPSPPFRFTLEEIVHLNRYGEKWQRTTEANEHERRKEAA